MKICSKCNMSKELCEFGVRGGKAVARCKKCLNEIAQIHRRSKHGLIQKIYHHQKDSSKLRGHDMPTYSFEDLEEMLIFDGRFLSLYGSWVKSDFNIMKTPSIDRKDDDIGYTMDNIQLMTWGENKAKGNADRREGRNNKDSKSVSKFSLSGEFISKFPSMQQASRISGIQASVIHSSCVNAIKKHNNFIWKYSEN